VNFPLTPFASSATFTAKRVVTYPGIQKPTFEEACSVAAADTITVAQMPLFVKHLHQYLQALV
jgi:hypothetical protein